MKSIIIPEGKVFSCFDSEDNLLYNGFHPEDYELDDSDTTFSANFVFSSTISLGWIFGLAIVLSNGIDPSEGYLPVAFDRTINGVVKNDLMIYQHTDMLYRFRAIKPVSEHEITLYMFTPNGKLLRHTIEKTAVVKYPGNL